MLPQTPRSHPRARALSINTSHDDETGHETGEVSPTNDSLAQIGHHTTDNLIRKSDTGDSLVALVGKFTSLAHLDNIEALPSPIVNAGTFEGRRSSSISSPLKEFVHGEHEVEPPVSGQLRPSGSSNKALPSKLIARLQGGERGSRHASLAMPQSLGSVEMPPMSRGRSQSQVPQYQGDGKLHREQNASHKSIGESKLDDAYDITDDIDATFRIPCNGALCTFTRIGDLGRGTFSSVVLARNTRDHGDLVAVKEVRFSDADPLDRARVETTVSREIALMKTLRHPLLIKMRGHSVQNEEALMALEYCPGGDLFTLASECRKLLTLRVIRRIFAELVTTVRFLHQNHVVHRDLKLENVLVRHRSATFEGLGPLNVLLTTLTDLGLARDFDPDSPDLSTRCGSEDYAAPEIIMGQTYDGRQTDAWALGAILYCLLEGRLPFDVIPGLEHRMISKVLHRICRIEWRWVTLKEAGTYDPEWDGAKRIVTNLLRSRTKRWTLDMVARDEWLRADIAAIEELIEQEQHQ